MSPIKCVRQQRGSRSALSGQLDHAPGTQKRGRKSGRAKGVLANSILASLPESMGNKHICVQRHPHETKHDQFSSGPSHMKTRLVGGPQMVLSKALDLAVRCQHLELTEVVLQHIFDVEAVKQLDHPT